MDFLDAVRLLFRRWLIVLIGVLLTGAACGAVVARVQTIYQAKAQYLLLLPAQATGEKNPQNPLINQPGGLVIAASLIASDINTRDSVRDMAENGFESDFAVGLAPDSGPLLTVQSTDTDPAAAIAQRDELLRRLDVELARIQTQQIRGVPANQVIASVTAAVNQNAEAVPGAKIKALTMVLALGALVTLVLAFALDGPLTRRRIRRRNKRLERDAAAEEQEPRAKGRFGGRPGRRSTPETSEDAESDTEESELVGKVTSWRSRVG